MLATIVSYTMITEDVLELILDMPEIIPYKPWQRALLSYTIDNIPVKRAYSIVEYLSQSDHCQITLSIKLLPGGKWSEYLKTKKIGDTLDIAGIYGHFVLQDTPNPKVFIGTWTGIAPLISMAKTSQAPQKLYFSVSYAKDLFYADKIRKISSLESHIHVSREWVEWCEEWRIDISTTEYPKESEFYICWSPSSVNAFAEILKNKGYTNIYIEKY